MHLNDDLSFAPLGDMEPLDLDDLTATDEKEPLVEWDTDTETTSRKEVVVIKSAFQQRASAEEKRLAETTNSEFWCCLVFQSAEQAEAFAAAMGEPGSRFVNGLKAAEACGVAMPRAGKHRGTRPIDRDWARIARKKGE